MQNALAMEALENPVFANRADADPLPRQARI
jgi:hypothetical protein